MTRRLIVILKIIAIGEEWIIACVAVSGENIGRARMERWMHGQKQGD